MPERPKQSRNEQRATLPVEQQVRMLNDDADDNENFQIEMRRAQFRAMVYIVGTLFAGASEAVFAIMFKR